ncbi:MAG: N-acetyl-alpha-D-glucosaminyl L-malate synthase BshA [Chitinophagales bacterium]|jgi:N-acetyl-alpha-D-glucosaminyl L-malate synthase BshA|nr:N-acetyl-alpha-D-glucosaminyl L-malate synthase BshA [Chitinophagales bacterium]
MLKIGIVCYPTYGGSGVVATELGKALADKGHQIHFITYNEPFRLDQFHPNINYHEVSFQNYALFEYPPYETALASRMVEIVLNESLDIIHVHYAIPHASAAYIAQQILITKGIHIPFITTLHGTDITLVGKDKSFLPVVAFSIEASNAVTAVSHALKKETYDHFSTQKEIEVIPNFIDFDRFSFQDKSHFRKAIAQDHQKIIIHISNFRKVKRVDDVMRLFAILRQEIDAILLMVGDGPDRTQTEELAKCLNINNYVKFLGKQKAVEELLSVSDLFVMPSQTESFGLAALEAMACRVPVVTSNSGGLPEIVENGVNGYMTEVGDYESMAKFGLEILKDKNHDKFRESAYLTAKKYSIEAIVPQYETLYHSVIHNFKTR